MSRIIVFFDTNVLLNAFAGFRSKHTMPHYMGGSDTDCYTFEKCVFEVYMAFRGMGGKKPDEGRGDWGQRHLKGENDPKIIGDLASLYSKGDKQDALYLINQILEFYGHDALEMFESYAIKNFPEDDLGFLLDRVNQLKGLRKERAKFEILCREFCDFLDKANIKILTYSEVFNSRPEGYPLLPTSLDGFVRDTAIPSEDFEIVYAAMVINADIFVTEDIRLINCSMSLGLNFPLSAFNFCKSDDFVKKIEEIRDSRDEAGII